MRNRNPFIALLAIAAPATGQASYYCEGKNSSSLDGRKQISTIRAWIKSPGEYRIEEEIQGAPGVTIARGGSVWHYFPARGRALHRKRTADELKRIKQGLMPLGDDRPGLLKAGVTKTGTDTILGVRCDVYKLRDRVGLIQTLWVKTGSEKLTIRRDVDGRQPFATRPGETMADHEVHRSLTLRWYKGRPMPASLFRLPSRVTVTNIRPPRPPSFKPYEPAARRPVSWPAIPKARSRR